MLHLLKRRSFGSMTLSQFLGAFNDNAFKMVVPIQNFTLRTRQ